MDAQALFHRYQELQRYVGWTEEHAHRVQSVAAWLEPHLPALVEDFYAEIDKHPQAKRVITGGVAQVSRLKVTLMNWLQELLHGPYDENYVVRRWRVGFRHVEIGLDQVYTNVALSRLRRGLLNAIEALSSDHPREAAAIRGAINLLLDLDLAIIEDAYQAEYHARQQRSERLATIGQVAGSIAHELRNPLNVVKTSAYYLLNARNISPEKCAEHLQRIEKHVTVADNVITALDNFARLPMPNLAPFHVGKCLADVLELTALPDSIQTMLDCPDSLPLVLADADQLRIVFGNLLRNAREAMLNGGSLGIVARLVEEGVEVAISDTGVGIPPDDLGRIMEPLYSTKARGMGLGLAICRSILEKNQGSLRVESQLGQGSTFTVRLLAAYVGQADSLSGQE